MAAYLTDTKYPTCWFVSVTLKVYPEFSFGSFLQKLWLWHVSWYWWFGVWIIWIGCKTDWLQFITELKYLLWKVSALKLSLFLTLWGFKNTGKKRGEWKKCKASTHVCVLKGPVEIISLSLCCSSTMVLHLCFWRNACPDPPARRSEMKPLK